MLSVGEPRPAGADLDRALTSLFGPGGLRLIPNLRRSRTVIENGASVRRSWTRCRAAASGLPAGACAIVVLPVGQTGIARLVRWILLPIQVAVATRALAQSGAQLLGRFAVFPDIQSCTVMYHLQSSAQRYAEAYVIPRPPAGGLARVMRRCLAIWARCDLSVGAIIIVGRKP